MWKNANPINLSTLRIQTLQCCNFMFYFHLAMMDALICLENVHPSIASSKRKKMSFTFALQVEFFIIQPNL